MAFRVGDLRRALEGLPDDMRVGVARSWGYTEASEVWVQASDAVDRPLGTDPEREATVGVLLIEFEESD